MQTRAGRLVTFGAELGRGGEGVVREVLGRADMVSKVYLVPIHQGHAEKIDAMVRTRTRAIEEFAAWPVEELLDAGCVRGFTMQRIPASFKPIHTLYGPKSRAIEFPGATWAFLGHVAMNVCRAFAAVHGAGHVVGDVNHDNIRVDSKGLVRLIDCDSFQVSSNGRRFRCRVGVPTHTPPELQGVQLDEVDRLPEHDAFGLAVVLFQLLLMGRHPFAGRFRGVGEMPIERAIVEHRFAYGPAAATLQMEQPPHAVGLEVVPPSVAALFRRAFEQGPPGRRPLPREWLDALEELRARLVRCGVNATHFHLPPADRCPWCTLEAVARVTLFGSAFVGASPSGTLNVDDLIRQMKSLAAPFKLARAPRPEEYSFTQADGLTATIAVWQAARAEANRQRLQWEIEREAEVKRLARRRELTPQNWAMVGAVATVLVFCFPPLGIGLGAVGAVAVGAVGGLTAFVVARYLTQGTPPPPIKSFAVPTPPVIEETLATLASAEGAFAAMNKRWPTLSTSPELSREHARLGTLIDEWRALPGVRERRIGELTQTTRERQLASFLARQRIESAGISNIGPTRKATLRSYGIETAADVNARAVGRIHGFGEGLTADLLRWRRNLESQFRFDPARGVPSSDVSAIDAEIARRRSMLEAELIAGTGRLGAMRAAHEGSIAKTHAELTDHAKAVATWRAAASGMSP